MSRKIIFEMEVPEEETIEFNATPNEVKGGGGKPVVTAYNNEIKCNHCHHEPRLYSAEFDGGICGDHTLFFCVCQKCKIRTLGHLSPIEAVRAWDKDEVYSNTWPINGANKKIIW